MKNKKNALVKIVDVFANCLLPILIGVLIYWLKPKISMPKIVVNYLADGLWVYALLSTILIIWNRKINMAWVLISFATAILFEVLQHQNIIAGVGDVNDVLCYLLFCIFALLINFYLKKIYD